MFGSCVGHFRISEMWISVDAFQSLRDPSGSYRSGLSVHSIGDQLVECVLEKSRMVYAVIISDADDELNKVISSYCSASEGNGYLGIGGIHDFFVKERYSYFEVFTVDVYIRRELPDLNNILVFLNHYGMDGGGDNGYQFTKRCLYLETVSALSRRVFINDLQIVDPLMELPMYKADQEYSIGSGLTVARKIGVDGKDARLVDNQMEEPIVFHRLEVYVAALKSRLDKVNLDALNELRQNYEPEDLYFEEGQAPF